MKECTQQRATAERRRANVKSKNIGCDKLQWRWCHSSCVLSAAGARPNAFAGTLFPIIVVIPHTSLQRQRFLTPPLYPSSLCGRKRNVTVTCKLKQRITQNVTYRVCVGPRVTTMELNRTHPGGVGPVELHCGDSGVDADPISNILSEPYLSPESWVRANTPSPIQLLSPSFSRLLNGQSANIY